MKKKLGTSEVKAVGLGTWEMGGRTYPDYTNDKQWIDIIRYALELGINHIDTAEMYGDGHTEELVGQAIEGHQRYSLFITTKVWSTHLAHDEVLKACERSLMRLKTEYIDLYLIHFPNPQIPIEETMAALNKLAEQKLVRNIGVSNFTTELIEQARSSSSFPIAANQIEYSLLARNNGTYVNHAESKIIPYCQKNNITVIAWRPLGKEKYSVLKEHSLLKQLSKKYNASPAQIAIAWLISKEGIITIPKTGNKEHLRENYQAMNLQLEPDDIKVLSDSFTN